MNKYMQDGLIEYIKLLEEGPLRFANDLDRERWEYEKSLIYKLIKYPELLRWEEFKIVADIVINGVIGRS